MATEYSAVHIAKLKSESEFWGDSSSPLLIMLQGEGSRQWLQGHYPPDPDNEKKCGHRIVIPEGPDDPNMILDGCLVFIPEIFSECKHYSLLKKIVDSKDVIDLNMEKPEEWDTIRKECVKYMGRLKLETVLLPNE